MVVEVVVDDRRKMSRRRKEREKRTEREMEKRMSRMSRILWDTLASEAHLGIKVVIGI
jgi:hypothetical protein